MCSPHQGAPNSWHPSQYSSMSGASMCPLNPSWLWIEWWSFLAVLSVFVYHLIYDNNIIMLKSIYCELWGCPVYLHILHCCIYFLEMFWVKRSCLIVALYDDQWEPHSTIKASPLAVKYFRIIMQLQNCMGTLMQPYIYCYDVIMFIIL